MCCGSETRGRLLLGSDLGTLEPGAGTGGGVGVADLRVAGGRGGLSTSLYACCCRLTCCTWPSSSITAHVQDMHSARV